MTTSKPTDAELIERASAIHNALKASGLLEAVNDITYKLHNRMANNRDDDGLYRAAERAISQLAAALEAAKAREERLRDLLNEIVVRFPINENDEWTPQIGLLMMARTALSDTEAK